MEKNWNETQLRALPEQILKIKWDFGIVFHKSVKMFTAATVFYAVTAVIGVDS